MFCIQLFQIITYNNQQKYKYIPELKLLKYIPFSSYHKSYLDYRVRNAKLCCHFSYYTQKFKMDDRALDKYKVIKEQVSHQDTAAARCAFLISGVGLGHAFEKLF